MSESDVVRAFDNAMYRFVARHGAEIETGRVLVEQSARISVGRNLIQIEEALVTLVRGDEERLVVAGPAFKACFHLCARCQVAYRPVRIAHVDVSELVPSLVTRVQDTVVGRKVRPRVNRLSSRLR